MFFSFGMIVCVSFTFPPGRVLLGASEAWAEVPFTVNWVFFRMHKSLDLRAIRRRIIRAEYLGQDSLSRRIDLIFGFLEERVIILKTVFRGDMPVGASGSLASCHWMFANFWLFLPELWFKNLDPHLCFLEHPLLIWSLFSTLLLPWSAWTQVFVLRIVNLISSGADRCRLASHRNLFCQITVIHLPRRLGSNYFLLYKRCWILEGQHRWVVWV